MKKIFITSMLLIGITTYAGGFRVALQGVKQAAMAHTSAHADDASVLFFNPAGMSFIPNKLSVVAGGFGVNSAITYQNKATLESYKTDNPLSTPIYAAAAYRVMDDLSVGVSLTTPYGSTVNWGNDWAGREIVQKLSLKAIFIQPTISYKFTEWMSLGFGYIIAKGSVDWDRAATQVNGNISLLDEKATGRGFNLGVFLRPSKNIDVSIAYRSPVDMKADHGVATFKVPQSLITSGTLPATDGFKATLPLVEEYTLGTTVKITPKWKVAGDINFQGWSNYNKLTLDFDNAKLSTNTDPTVVEVPKNWKNSKVYRIGTEYQITDMFAGRLGYYYDESPVSNSNWSPESPSFNSNVITGGLGVKVGKLGVDISGSYNLLQARSINNSFYNFTGQAKAKVFTFGLGLSYNAF